MAPVRRECKLFVSAPPPPGASLQVFKGGRRGEKGGKEGGLGDVQEGEGLRDVQGEGGKGNEA